MALDVQISFSWTNYCRLCLLDNGIMLPLFEEEGQSRQLGLKIETCLQLVTYDGDPLPRKICHMCLYKINQTYEFRTMVLKSYERLKAHLLPLKHVPEVQQYLDKTERLQKYGGCDATSSAHCSSPSRDSVWSDCSQPKIRVKTEKELMEDPSWSPLLSSSSTSHFDSVDQTSLYSSSTFLNSSVMSSQNKESSVTPNQESVTLQQDSLKRKRHLAGGSVGSDDSDSPDCDVLKNPEPELSKKVQKRKMLACPASRKKQVHSTTRKCEICSLSFESQLHLTKCLKCARCQEDFSSIAEKAVHEAKEHIKVFVDSNVKHLPVRCSLCPARFTSNVMLNTHSAHDHAGPRDQTQKHSSNVRPLSLDVGCAAVPGVENEDLECQTSDNDDACLQSINESPVKMGSNQNNTPDECSKCQRIFISPTTLQSHVCLNKQASNHLCKFCDESFRTSFALLQHEKAIHGKFRCSLCDECFVNFHALNSHKRKHKIPIHKRRSTKQEQQTDDGSLKKLVDSATKQKVLSCHTCYEQFDNEDAFILHLYHHAVELSDDENVPKKKSRKKLSLPKKAMSLSGTVEINSPVEQFSVKCERCHVVCRSKEYYKVHLATHMSKAKTSFPCGGCSQDFRNVEALNRHTCSEKSKDIQTCCLDCGQNLVLSESHVCDNKCPECDKVFKSSRGQRLHFVSKHRNKAHDGNDFDDDSPLLAVGDDGLDTESLHAGVDNEYISLEEEQTDQSDKTEAEDVSPVKQPSEREALCNGVGEANSFMERLPPDGAPLD